MVQFLKQIRNLYFLSTVLLTAISAGLYTGFIKLSLIRKFSSIHAFSYIIGSTIPSMICYGLLSYCLGLGLFVHEEYFQHSLLTQTLDLGILI